MSTQSSMRLEPHWARTDGSFDSRRDIAFDVGGLRLVRRLEPAPLSLHWFLLGVDGSARTYPSRCIGPHDAASIEQSTAFGRKAHRSVKQVPPPSAQTPVHKTPSVTHAHAREHCRDSAAVEREAPGSRARPHPIQWGEGGLSNQRAGGWCSALQELRARRQAVERSPISGALAVQNGQVALHGLSR